MARRNNSEEPPPHPPFPGERRKVDVLDTGLPHNEMAERLVLGMILLNDERFSQVDGLLTPEHFHLEKHRRLYSAMKSIADAGEVKIDHVTLFEELNRKGHTESVDGLAGIVSLTDGLPDVPNLTSYVRIIQEKHALRRAIREAQTIIDKCLLAQDDAADILTSAEPRFREISAWDEKETTGRTPAQVLENFPGGMTAFMDPTQRPKGLPYGFKRLDELTTGMHAGELIVIAARPRVGKSMFAMNIASHIAGAFNPMIEKRRVHYFSLEMSAESLMTRLMCSVAKVDQHRFRCGYLNDGERYKLQSALYDITESKLVLDDKFKKTMSQVERRIKKAVKEEDAALVVIDQLSLMTTDRKEASRQAVVSDITRGLKLLAGEVGIPFILINQLSRAADLAEKGGGGRPQLEHLKASGCIPGDSLVTLADGTRERIDALVGKQNVRILGLNQDTLKVEPFDASRVFPSGNKPVHEIVLASGRVVKATANHQFLTIDGWVSVDQLPIGKHLATPRAMRTTGPATMSRDELALLAHLIGNGTIVNKQPTHYTTFDLDVAEFVKATAARMFTTINPHIETTRNHWDLYFNSTKRHTHGVWSDLRIWLERFGLWNHRALDKFIPEAVMAQPNDSLAWFLGNLWSTDGCITAPMGKSAAKAYYSTSSERLARDVQYALSRIGIRSRVKPIPQKHSPNPNWHVTISGVIDLALFCDLIPSIGERRQSRLADLACFVKSVKPNTNLDVIPCEAWKTVVLPAMATRFVTSRLLRRVTTGIRQNNGLSRARAASIAQEIASQNLMRLAESDIYWDRIVSITQAGTVDVFDMTVPGCSNFVANGIIAHNSLEEDADTVLLIHREELRKRDRDDLKGKAEVIIAKQRNGEEAIVKLLCQGKYSRFEDASDEPDPTPESDD